MKLVLQSDTYSAPFLNREKRIGGSEMEESERVIRCRWCLSKQSTAKPQESKRVSTLDLIDKG